MGTDNGIDPALRAEIYEHCRQQLVRDGVGPFQLYLGCIALGSVSPPIPVSREAFVSVGRQVLREHLGTLSRGEDEPPREH